MKREILIGVITSVITAVITSGAVWVWMANSIDETSLRLLATKIVANDEFYEQLKKENICKINLIKIDDLKIKIKEINNKIITLNNAIPIYSKWLSQESNYVTPQGIKIKIGNITTTKGEIESFSINKLSLSNIYNGYRNTFYYDNVKYFFEIKCTNASAEELNLAIYKTPLPPDF